MTNLIDLIKGYNEPNLHGFTIVIIAEKTICDNHITRLNINN